MPKSITIPVIISIVALFVYLTIYRNGNPPLTTPAYVTFTLDVLPHMGSATMKGRVEVGEKVIINIRTFLDAHKPPDRVLPSML
jgi:lactate dehydrogenase-like 2-hydroxyacid dehydrogenase